MRGKVSDMKNLGRIYRPRLKRPNGAVQESSIWWIDYHINGVRHRESTQIRVAMTTLKSSCSNARWGMRDPLEPDCQQDVTCAELLDDVLLDYEVNEKSLEWARIVDGHLRPFFGPMPASAVSTAAINRYIAQRRREGVKNATINREFTILRRAFNLALKSTPPRIAHRAPHPQAGRERSA